MSYKTTKKDFKQFKLYCEEYIKFFNLEHFRIEYEYEKEADDYRAAYSINLTGQCGCIFFPPKWDVPVTPKELKATALHEVLHFLIAPLYLLGLESTDPVLEMEQHRIIRAFEKKIGQKIP